MRQLGVGVGRRSARVLGLAVGALLLAGCGQESADWYQSFGLPEPASDRAPFIGDIWVGTWVAALAVGVMVWGLILWASVAYRHKAGDPPPRQTRYHIPIETLYTVVPLLIIGVLFYWTVIQADEVLADDQEPDVRIGVIGQQWSWTFNYLDDDVYDVGTAVESPTLVLPVNQVVEFTLNAPDVIHAFWVPAFYFKMDVIPGRTNVFQLTPTREGTFAGRCSELCGVYHTRMIFEVEVVSEEEYEAHLAELAERGQTGIIDVPLRGAFDPEQQDLAGVTEGEQ
jgi:cytochrome c oxidase subunit 2